MTRGPTSSSSCTTAGGQRIQASDHSTPKAQMPAMCCYGLCRVLWLMLCVEEKFRLGLGVRAFKPPTAALPVAAALQPRAGVLWVMDYLCSVVHAKGFCT
jgi:hypothetical protein